MKPFVDPRDKPTPATSNTCRRTTIEVSELADLHLLCRESRLYEVEQWIRAGRPLQLASGASLTRRRKTSALEIALEAQNQALVLLLLCNGYDPNLDPDSPLDLALQARRWDILDLLLDWGADPTQVNLEDLFGTYNSKLFGRFRALGVHLTSGHALAHALAHHTSNKPLFGFAKRHRARDPNIQREVNIALAHHADEGNEKGVHLSLRAGADPHAPAPSLRYGTNLEEDDENGDDDRFMGFSAVWQACSSGHAAILERLGPDPSLDDFDDLYGATRSETVIELLARKALPHNAGAVIHSQLIRLSWNTGWGFGTWGSVRTLNRLFEVGARWKESPAETIAAVRFTLLRLTDDTFIDVIKVLATGDYCAPDILHELARTPAMRRRLKEVGFFPPPPDEPYRQGRHRPTRSREVLAKLGVELPKPKKLSPYVPRIVGIGTRRPGCRELRLDRAALFDRVWSQPVMKLADEWGLSGPGLAKACRRLQVPVPPRGYWAKLEAGRRVRRPRLPSLEPGQADEIVIWVPE